MGQLSGILEIFNTNTAESVFERISLVGYFTNVIGVPFSEIRASGLALVRLHAGHIDPALYVCILKRQSKIATGQVRLKATNIIELKHITKDQLISALPKEMRNRAKNYFGEEYKKLPPKLGEGIFNAIKDLNPDISDNLDNLFEALNSQRVVSSTAREEDAAIEKDALGLSLDIFGIDRTDVFKRWEKNDTNIGESFLSSLTEFTVYEDDVINYDLHKFPGFDKLKQDVYSTITGVVEFESQYGEKLTVINANRKPMEKAMGVDLIYFHRRFASFVMIQYKMMDQRSDLHKSYYYNPNQKSHNEELERLKKMKSLIDKENSPSDLAGYRFSNCSLFFKLCKKIELKMDDHSLAPGMYIPLDQWELLLEDKTTLGAKGGRQFGYHTLHKRYMNKDTFVDLIQAGFIGTRGNASEKLALFIEDAISKGKSVMYAIDERMDAPPSKNQPLKRKIFDDLLPEHLNDDDLPF
ncbi:hypothetical protein BN1088_60007 [Sphingobacterium sp. PM2-P1-29]|nr:hypothetical protein BN1088_60007 [Sphingobacterium sp. PM2-P1-29]